MPESQPEPKSSGTRSFWSTFPGVMTAVGGFVAAVATLLTALVSAGVLGGRATPTSVPAVTATVAFATATVAPQAPVAPATPLAPSASAAPQVSPTPLSGAVLMEDDFSSSRNGWLSEVTEQAEKGYEDGEFHITVYEPEFSTWSYPDPPRGFADFALEVDARRVSGPLDNEFGVQVHYQSDTDAFYLFAISSNGFYSVQKYEAGEWQQLVDWAESPAIQQGDAVNRLRVTCQGDRMRFFANGEPLAQVEDSSFRSGSVGLLASSADKGGVVVAFDNLRVRALSATEGQSLRIIPAIFRSVTGNG
jgi:hypothetical protein